MSDSTLYLPILIMSGVAFLLATLMCLLPFLLAPSASDRQKDSTYECGFEPIGNLRSKYDVRFYIVGIIFMVFDLEIVFMLPWIIHMKALGVVAFLGVMLFLAVLTVGLLYEWSKGVLDLH